MKLFHIIANRLLELEELEKIIVHWVNLENLEDSFIWDGE